MLTGFQVTLAALRAGAQVLFDDDGNTWLVDPDTGVRASLDYDEWQKLIAGNFIAYSYTTYDPATWVYVANPA